MSLKIDTRTSVLPSDLQPTTVPGQVPGQVAGRAPAASAASAASAAPAPAARDLLSSEGPSALAGTAPAGERMDVGDAVGPELLARLSSLLAKAGAPRGEAAGAGDVDFAVAPGALFNLPAAASRGQGAIGATISGIESDPQGAAAVLDVLAAQVQSLSTAQQLAGQQALPNLGAVAAPLRQFADSVVGAALGSQAGALQMSAADQARMSELFSQSGAMDIEAFVQYVLRESYLDQLEDLRFFGLKVKFFNEQKKAVREALQSMRTIMSGLGGVPAEAKGSTDLAGGQTSLTAGAGGMAAAAGASTAGAGSYPTGVAGGAQAAFAGYDLGSGTQNTLQAGSWVDTEHTGKSSRKGYSNDDMRSWFDSIIEEYFGTYGFSSLSAKEQEALMKKFRESGISFSFTGQDYDPLSSDEDLSYSVTIKANANESFEQFVARIKKDYRGKFADKIDSQDGEGGNTEIYDARISITSYSAATVESAFNQKIDDCQTNAERLALLLGPDGLGSGTLSQPMLDTLRASLPYATGADLTLLADKINGLSNLPADQKERLLKDVIKAVDNADKLKALADHLGTTSAVGRFATSAYNAVLFSEKLSSASVKSDAASIGACYDSLMDRLALYPEGDLPDRLVRDIQAAVQSGILDNKQLESLINGLKGMSGKLAGDLATAITADWQAQLTRDFSKDFNKATVANDPAARQNVLDSLGGRLDQVAAGTMEVDATLIAHLKMAMAAEPPLIDLTTEPSLVEVLDKVGQDWSANGSLGLRELVSALPADQLGAVAKAYGALGSARQDVKDLLAGREPRALAGDVTGAATGGTGETNTTAASVSAGAPASYESLSPQAVRYAAPDLDPSDGSIDALVLISEPPYVVADPSGAKWTTVAELETAITNLEEKLNSLGDDAQLANVDLQNALQKQQQLIQMMSNISKMLHDTALNTIRKMG